MNTRETNQTLAQPELLDPRRVLTLFDCVCIIVGTIIGAGIFEMPAIVSANVSSVYWLAGVWIFGGFIALSGALCFAELTTTYPDHGGDYGYLKRGYHRRVGFAFSWAAFWVIRPGNIGAMAMIFGKFAAQIFPDSLSPLWFALLSVIVLSATNLLGVTFGKTTQNLLTVAKVVGILLIVFAGFIFGADRSAMTDLALAGRDSQAAVEATDPTGETSSATLADVRQANDPSASTESSPSSSAPGSRWNSFWLAMVFVMFAFGGWNDIAFVAKEVKQPEKNLFRSLVIGTFCVLAIYLLVNFSLVFGLSFETMSSLGRQWQNPTSFLVERNLGQFGLTCFALLVCVSCLGAINAMVFTSPRIYWATAMDYPALGWLAGSTESRQGWWRAMLLQGAVTIVFVLTFGFRGDGIDKIVVATAPYFWLFLSLTVISLIINRVRFRGVFSGYRVPFYPVLPLIFVAACLFMMVQGWQYTLAQDLWKSTLLIGLWVFIGVGLSFCLRNAAPCKQEPAQEP